MANGKLGASFSKLNNKLTDLLEENQRLKQQYKTLQEGTQGTFRINSELKEKLQEKDKQLEKLQQHVLNLEQQKLEENQKLKQQYEILQEKNKETLSINSELKEKLLNLEKQSNEIQQIEEISQKFLEILDLDDIDENDIKILKEKNKSFIDKNSEQQNYNMPGKTTTFPDSDNVLFDIENSSKPSWKPFNKSKNFGNQTGCSTEDTCIRIVVGLDFGTTYSGFSYCHISNTSSDICTNDQWPGEANQLKTNTVLQYDEGYNEVELWGYPALFKRPNRKKNRETKTKIIELFKLYLGNSQERPGLPVNYKKAITDYLYELGKLIKETVETRWQSIDFFENVLIVFPVPAEYTNQNLAILRECIYSANLIDSKYSTTLRFITEPEAAAVYCMENILQEHDLLTVGTTFMVVDCGGGTVDLTTRTLVGSKQLGEVTERIGDFCGSTFIDKEFIKFLKGKLGTRAIDLLVENHYGQFQYMVHKFCRRIKEPFTGDDTEFPYELDVEDNAPILLEYVNEETRKIMEYNEWLIKINYNDVKKMFDPVIDRIISMIHVQLSNNQQTCSAIFLVGGFSENKYLQKRVKQEFQHRVNTITVPNQPIAAIGRGAAIYGLSLKNSSNWDKINDHKFMISTRTLKFTYGIKVREYWTKGDPIHRKTNDGRIDKFDCLAKRGMVANIDQEITRSYKPLSPAQTKGVFNIYYTKEYDAEYCDEPGMRLLGKFTMNLPGLRQDRIIFGLNFGQMEITATAKNETTGQIFETTFEIDTE